jgi:hypothetical protein
MEAARFTVKVPTIEPVVPDVCVGCLGAPTIKRRLVFRRSDGTVERVSAVFWPYCDPCVLTLARLDRMQRWMTLTGALQMLVIVYAVGAAIGKYDMWWPSLAFLAVFFVAFGQVAKKARSLWSLEHARIDDVYKGGAGAAYSFRNRGYAERFASANGGAA